MKKIKSLEALKNILKMSKIVGELQIYITHKKDNSLNVTVYNDKKTLKETIRGTVKLDENKKFISVHFFSHCIFFHNVQLDLLDINRRLYEKDLDIVEILDVNVLRIEEAVNDFMANKEDVQGISVEEKVEAVLKKMDKQVPTLEAMSAAIDEAYNNRHLFVEVINSVGSIKISEKDIEEDFYSLVDLNTLYKICVKKTNPITNQ